MKKLWKAIDHNQMLSVMVLVSIGIVYYVVGCQSTVRSILNPTTKLTREELKVEVDVEVRRLEAELDKLSAQAALKNKDLDRQDEIKRKLVEFGLSISTGGQINPLGVATLVGGLLGVGFAVDNRSKDKLIKTLKNNK